MNKVRLVCKGQEFSHWTKVTITSGLNELSRSFTLEVTYMLPRQNHLHDLFKPGDKVQIFIDDDLILSGYIDKTPIRYDAHSINVQIIGRSKTVDLIECNPWPEGDPIQFDNDWTVAPTPSDLIVYEPNSVTTRSKHKDKLGTALATLVGAYGIRLKAYNDPDIRKKLDAVKDVNVKPESTLYDIIAAVVIGNDILITDDENGDLLVIKKGGQKASDDLTLGNNILTGSADFDATKLFQTYSCSGHKKGDDNVSGRQLQTNGRAVDDQVSRRRYKYLNNVSEDDNCLNQAEGERDFQRAQYEKVTYTVYGWRQRKSNELWKINQTVKVTDFMLGFNEKEMLIQKVDFSLDNSGGMITTLEVIPPEGYKTEPKKGAEANTPSSSKSFSQVNNSLISNQSLKLNKNRY